MKTQNLTIKDVQDRFYQLLGIDKPEEFVSPNYNPYYFIDWDENENKINLSTEIIGCVKTPTYFVMVCIDCPIKDYCHSWPLTYENYKELKGMLDEVHRLHKGEVNE